MNITELPQSGWKIKEEKMLTHDDGVVTQFVIFHPRLIHNRENSFPFRTLEQAQAYLFYEMNVR